MADLRNQIIQTLLATRGQSEGVTADALIGLMGQSGAVADSEAEIYAIYYLDNWDGEGDKYWLLATKTNDRFYSADSGKPLLEYDGDQLLRVVPLSRHPAPAVDDALDADLLRRLVFLWGEGWFTDDDENLIEFQGLMACLADAMKEQSNENAG